MRFYFYLFFSVIFPLQVLALTTLRIAMETKMPYVGMNEKEAPEGYIYDILHDLALKNKDKYKFEFVNIPLLREMQAVQKDEVDFAVMPGSMVRYSSNVSIVTTAFGVSYAGALTLSPELEALYDLSELRGKSILLSYLGPETDRLRDEVLEEAGGKKTELIDVSGADIPQRMMLMMANHRADIALGDYNTLRFSMTKNKTSQINLIPTSLIGFSVVQLVTRKNKKTFEEFNEDVRAWFQDARKNGRLDEILKKYNLSDWANLLSH